MQTQEQQQELGRPLLAQMLTLPAGRGQAQQVVQIQVGQEQELQEQELVLLQAPLLALLLQAPLPPCLEARGPLLLLPPEELALIVSLLLKSMDCDEDQEVSMQLLLFGAWLHH